MSNLCLSQRTDALSQHRSYGYDGNGNVTSITDELGRTVHFAYDSRNRRTSSTDANSNVTRYGYDANDNLVSIIYADGSQERMSYDARNRKTSHLMANGDQQPFAYDSLDNLVQERDPLLAATTNTYRYDALNRLTYVQDSTGHFTNFQCDISDKMTASTDELGRTSEKFYDNLDRLMEAIDPAKGTTTKTATL